MKRSPLELAAIATAAVPGLTPVGVAGIPDDPDDFESALIIDAQENRWRVRSPRHEESSMRLETELTALRSFTPGIRASLPFRLPSVAGTVRQGSLRTFVYNHLPGAVMDLEDLVATGGATAADIGRVIAAIHALPADLVDRADLPVYTANEFRQRRLNELDQAATTGRIPPRLLRRWEHALEDVALWRFNPRVVHGDLHEENLLLEDGKVAAVTGWTDVRIGDPADDFAWLAAAHEHSFTDAVVESYTASRGDLADPHILRRAALAAEFALAQWFTRGLATNDAERIAEGEQMLRDLDEDIAEYGGQPISIVEPPRMDIDGQPLPTATPGEPPARRPGSEAPASDAAGQQTPADLVAAGVPPHPTVPPKAGEARVSHWGPAGIDLPGTDAADGPGEMVAGNPADIPADTPADSEMDQAAEDHAVDPAAVDAAPADATPVEAVGEPDDGDASGHRHGAAGSGEPPEGAVGTSVPAEEGPEATEDRQGQQDKRGQQDEVGGGGEPDADDGPAFLRDIDVVAGDPAADADGEEASTPGQGAETDALPLIVVDPDNGMARPTRESTEK